jgi:hypothetical protein
MTPENIEAILRTVRLGVWPDRAAEMHGIAKGTLRSHRKRDPAFATALKKAEADAEAAIHSKILRHMDRQWTAAAWMLERRWPSRWRKHEQQQMEMRMQVEQKGPPEPSDHKSLADYAEAFAAAAAAMMPRGGDDATPDAS